MNRWAPADVEAVVIRPQPKGLEDLWNQAPSGSALPADGRAALLNANQDAITQGLSLLQQKAIAHAGVSVGFRPEVFAQLSNLPGVDVVAETVLASLRGGLDLGKLNAAARKLLTDVIISVGEKMGAPVALPDYSSAVGAVVAVVWGVIETIVNAERGWQAYRDAMKVEALDCAPPAYSAETDRALASDATDVLGAVDWSDVFLPVIQPTNGFTCCISAVDGGRVIAPVGIGIGNRFQSALKPWGGASGDWMPDFYGSFLGYGCLPMLPDYPVHRAIVFPNGGWHLIYDPAWSLAQLGGVGIQVFKLLTNLGPATYTVDGDGIASAWSEYFQIMRTQISKNGPGLGTAEWGESVCDDWGKEGRMRALGWIWQKIYNGNVPEAASGDGIWTFEDSLPVSTWRRFNEIQGALLGYTPGTNRKGPPRPVAFYVDARTCHPAWRARVDMAQRELLDIGDAVCSGYVDLDSIPDREYRQAVADRRRQKAGRCISMSDVSSSFKGVSATTGPSLEPLGEGSPLIPVMPAFPQPPRGEVKAPRRGGGSKTPLVLGAAALGGLGLLKLLRRR